MSADQGLLALPPTKSCQHHVFAGSLGKLQRCIREGLLVAGALFADCCALAAW